MKKIHAREVTLKIFMNWPEKKINARVMLTKKIQAAQPHPSPVTFVMVRLD